MKKSNMLIAVFATVMAAATAAKAGDSAVDFDGKTSGSLNLTQSIRENMQVAGDLPLPQAAPTLFSPLSSGACAVFCQYGINDDCSCKKDWLQEFLEQCGTACQPVPLDGGWYEMARWGGNPVDWELKGAQGQTRSVAAPRMFNTDLQQKLRDILMGYCNTYPEFAEVVLPMLKDEKTKIVARDGFVYILSGNSIIRFSGKKPGEADKRGSSLPGWLGPAADAAGAVIGAVNAWNEYHSYPPIPDSGEANNYHGPALTVDPNDSDLHSYNSGSSEE